MCTAGTAGAALAPMVGTVIAGPAAETTTIRMTSLTMMTDAIMMTDVTTMALPRSYLDPSAGRVVAARAKSTVIVFAGGAPAAEDVHAA